MGVRTLDLVVVSLEQKGERNKKRRERALTALGPAALVFPVAGVSVRQGATSAAAAWCVREMWREKKGMARVTGEGCRCWAFCSCESEAVRPIQITADQRLQAASVNMGQFRPRRARRAGRVGGPAVGCWSTGPV
jgi:hypothetical protein